MPIFTDEQMQGVPSLPSVPTLPYQVPGGTQAGAAATAQALQQKEEESTQGYYDELNRRNENAASKLMQHRSALLAPTSDDDIFGVSALGQAAGFGGGDIATQARNQQIKHGYKVEQNQDWNNKAAAIDSTGKDATFAIQELNNFRARGGQGVASQTDQKLPPGNLGVAQGILGNRTWDLRPAMLTKLQTPLNDVFSSMRDAIDAKHYSLDQAADFFQPYGLTRDQVAQAIKSRSAPQSWKPAGGAVDVNRSGHVPPAASPLPGAGGDHGDQEGARPLPGGQMGRGPPRGNKMRPGYQAGFSGGPEDGGQGSGNATNRSGMEPGQEGVGLPPMPKQIYQPRSFQYESAMRLLQRKPELAGEIDKRLFPGFPGTSKRLLEQMQSGGQ